MSKNEVYDIRKLSKYEKVVVPIIQRDFVYGLETESAKKFIGDIFACLCESLTIDFGFIYGYHNKEKTIFYVIDGQQRLTTLYLLQQYLYWKDDNKIDGGNFFKLSYEVRNTTRDFLTELSGKCFLSSLEVKNNKKLSDFIKESTLFQREWSYDPSIKAMLEVLDVIRNNSLKYSNVNFLSLENIKFQFLSMDDFGLTDDLYIKMNARGKPLTAFENFKVWLEKEIDGNVDLKKKLNQEFKDWKTELDVDWLNIFWRLDNKEPVEHLNKCYLRFFYGNAINKIAESGTIDGVEKTIGDFISKSSCSGAIPAKHENLKELFNDYSIQYCFEILDFYKETHDHNTTMLNSYYKKSCQLRLFGDTDSDKNIFDDFLNIEKSQKNFISEEHRYRRQIVFYAYTSCIMKFGFDDNLQDWLRVIINLSINSSLNVKSFILSISSVKAIINDPDFSGKIYVYLNNKNQSIFNGFDNYQAREEIEKAKLITNDSRWKDVLHEAEEHDFFQGQIYFLLQLAGAEDGGSSEEKLENFKKYSTKAIDIFKEKNIKDDFLLQRGLLAVCNESYFRELSSWIRRFGSYKSEWRNDFFKNKEFIEKLQRFIDALLLSSSTFKDFVSSEISNWHIDGKNNWLYFFIKSPEVFKRCYDGNLRYQDGDLGNIYLLDGSRLGSESGYKAELRTYFLYEYYLKNNLSKIDESKKCNYNSTSGLSSLPSKKSCVYIDHWEFGIYKIALDIFYEKGRFYFRFFIRNSIAGDEKIRILDQIYNELKEYQLGGKKFDGPCFETDKNDIANLMLKFIPENELIPPKQNEHVFTSILQTFDKAVKKAQANLAVE